MSARRTARLAISVLGTLLLAFVLFISWTLWDSRWRTMSLTAEPLALRDDATALRKVGYDPAAFAPSSPGARSDFAPDLRRFDFLPVPGATTADRLGVHVRLEQEGTTVVCNVARKK